MKSKNTSRVVEYHLPAVNLGQGFKVNPFWSYGTSSLVQIQTPGDNYLIIDALLSCNDLKYEGHISINEESRVIWDIDILTGWIR